MDLARGKIRNLCNYIFQVAHGDLLRLILTTSGIYPTWFCVLPDLDTKDVAAQTEAESSFNLTECNVRVS